MGTIVVVLTLIVAGKTIETIIAITQVVVIAQAIANACIHVHTVPRAARVARYARRQLLV